MKDEPSGIQSKIGIKSVHVLVFLQKSKLLHIKFSYQFFLFIYIIYDKETQLKTNVVIEESLG